MHNWTVSGNRVASMDAKIIELSKNYVVKEKLCTLYVNTLKSRRLQKEISKLY